MCHLLDSFTQVKAHNIVKGSNVNFRKLNQHVKFPAIYKCTSLRFIIKIVEKGSSLFGLPEELLVLND